MDNLFYKVFVLTLNLSGKFEVFRNIRIRFYWICEDNYQEYLVYYFSRINFVFIISFQKIVTVL